MTEEQKNFRFQELRKRSRESGLSETERAELALLIQEIERAEANHLGPATERFRHEREAIDTQNRTLEALTRRKQALVVRLRDFLTETQAEKRAIDNELAAVLGENNGL